MLPLERDISRFLKVCSMDGIGLSRHGIILNPLPSSNGFPVNFETRHLKFSLQFNELSAAFRAIFIDC